MTGPEGRRLSQQRENASKFVLIKYFSVVNICVTCSKIADRFYIFIIPLTDSITWQRSVNLPLGAVKWRRKPRTQGSRSGSGQTLIVHLQPRCTEVSGPTRWSSSWLLQDRLLVWETSGGSLTCATRTVEVSQSGGEGEGDWRWLRVGVRVSHGFSPQESSSSRTSSSSSPVESRSSCWRRLWASSPNRAASPSGGEYVHCLKVSSSSSGTVQPHSGGEVLSTVVSHLQICGFNFRGYSKSLWSERLEKFWETTRKRFELFYIHKVQTI